jgi:hypothetical protein
MVFVTVYGLDCLISLSQSRHHICINCGVSASGSMGLAQGMPVHAKFFNEVISDRGCNVTSLSTTLLTRNVLNRMIRFS